MTRRILLAPDIFHHSFLSLRNMQISMAVDANASRETLYTIIGKLKRDECEKINNSNNNDHHLLVYQTGRSFLLEGRGRFEPFSEF